MDCLGFPTKLNSFEILPTLINQRLRVPKIFQKQIGSVGYIYLQFTMKINHSWIGKCTVRPMDPSWDMM